jgi:hypothetical protein
MSSWNWQKVLFTSAAIAIVAGVSFLLASAGRQDPVLDRPPQVIREIDPQEFTEQGPDAPSQGGLVVVPSELLVENAQPGVSLPAIKVTNRSAVRQAINIDFVPVTRASDRGVPVIGVGPNELAAGRQLVAVSPQRANLRPGESVDLRARIVGRPDGGRALVGAIGVSAGSEQDLRPPERRGIGVVIENVYRINAMVYASFEDSEDNRVELRYLRAEQDGNQIRFLAGVESVGQAIATPQGSVEIFDQSGQRVAGGSLAGDQRVIPGQRQELVLLNPVSGLPPGIYQAEARVVQDGAGQALRRPIEIAANGQLSDVKADLALTAERINSRPGQIYPLELQLLNSGNKGYQARGRVELFAPGQSKALLQRRVAFGTLQPDDIATETISFPAPKNKGSYAVVASVVDQQGELLVEKTISMGVADQADSEPSLSVRIRDWLSADILRAVALGAVTFGLIFALLGGIATAARHWRRRKTKN